ncbi:RNA pseudouridylate synthase domain-containing protein 1 isoform X3 [Nomia melanderi]|uniref:RNA pseudouridylate synthase domain-containing protein 1 isoform X3 n=1 Tax=Nomia melanderi TaxID=2448451 RepID=UPI00130424BF|nr:RNA pseudouridylate synthase domain-containing protein 1-like isoform X3 [Nomia melanderi]
MNINEILYNWSMLIVKLTQIILRLLKLHLKEFMKFRHRNNVNILHRSENFLVVSKPYDMYINSNNPKKKNTLQSELKKILPNLANPSLFHEFHFVHRLDYATSGIICIALNKKAARAASNAFETRRVKKFYLALLHGHVNEPYLVIDKPIEHGFRNGKPATKVLLCPETGRRHQLRVHCSYIGHTVIGDYTYSERKDVEPYRTFLHSFRYMFHTVVSHNVLTSVSFLRLILNNDVENLDIKSIDPFQASDPRNQWSPTNIARVLDENIFFEIYNLMQ